MSALFFALLLSLNTSLLICPNVVGEMPGFAIEEDQYHAWLLAVRIQLN